MHEIKLYKHPLKSLKIIFPSLIFVMGSIWMLSKNASSILFWFAIIFFGMCLCVGLFHLFDRRPQIVINKIGIRDRTINQNLIKWDSIAEAYEFNVGAQIYVALAINYKFQPKTKLFNWANNMNKYMGAGDLNLNISQIKISTDKLVTLINILKAEPSENRDLIINSYRIELK